MNPTAKQINKLLGTKRCTVHKTAKRPSRQKLNASVKKELA